MDSGYWVVEYVKLQYMKYVEKEELPTNGSKCITL